MGKRCVIVALCSEEPPVLAYSTIVQFLPGQASRRATSKYALFFSLKTKGTEVTREVRPTGLLSAV